MSEIIHSDHIPMAQAGIDQQIATAKQFPRDLKACRDELIAVVTLDLDTAEGCLYSLPRDGKAVTGPSVRLAEMAVSAWGNIRAGWRPIGETDRAVTCEAVCHDLQKNVVNTATCTRGIVGRHGRYSDSMIQTTIMAAGAIAYRNAVFKTIPGALIKSALQASQDYVIAEVGDYGQRLGEMLSWFETQGATEQQVLAYFGASKPGEITAQQFRIALGIANTIKDGGATAADYFGGRRKGRQEKTGGSVEDILGTNGGDE